MCNSRVDTEKRLLCVFLCLWRYLIVLSPSHRLHDGYSLEHKQPKLIYRGVIDRFAEYRSGLLLPRLCHKRAERGREECARMTSRRPCNALGKRTVQGAGFSFRTGPQPPPRLTPLDNAIVWPIAKYREPRTTCSFGQFPADSGVQPVLPPIGRV